MENVKNAKLMRNAKKPTQRSQIVISIQKIVIKESASNALMMIHAKTQLTHFVKLENWMEHVENVTLMRSAYELVETHQSVTKEIVRDALVINRHGGRITTFGFDVNTAPALEEGEGAGAKNVNIEEERFTPGNTELYLSIY